MAIQRRLVEAVEVTDSQIHIIRLKGIFDASTVSEFEKVVSYLLARSFFEMVVDLGDVEFISSAGWGAFTAELRRVRENEGDIKLAGMNADLFDIFLLLELDHFIKAYDYEDEAITAFLQPPAIPEPVVESPLEARQPPVVAQTPARPVEETIATRLPAVYEAPPPMIFEQPGENEVEYQETYAIESETFEVESEFSSFGRREGNGFSQENYVTDEDTLEIDARLPRSATGPEMYELLLTSGRPALDPAIARRALPPPSLTAPDDGHDSGVANSTADRPARDDFHSESEFGFDEHDSISDDNGHAETHGFSDLLSTADLDFSGHEPIVEDNDEKLNFAELRSRPKSDFSEAASGDFSGQELEPFSELSLNLESHLHTHNAAASSPRFGAQTESEFSPRRNNNETQEFEAPMFSPGGEFFESGDHNHESFDAEFSETFQVKSDFSGTPPIFDHGDKTEDFSAPQLSNSLTDFSSQVFSAFKKPASEHDDEFETQDIRDPWILEEIDTLPEEYEMEEAAPQDIDLPIAASTYMPDDFDMDSEPPMPKPENSIKPGGASIAEGKFAPPFSPAEKSSEAVGVGGRDINMAPNEPAATAWDEAMFAAENSPEDARASGKKEPVLEPMDQTDLPKIPMSGNIAEMIRGIITAYPDYGPGMICKFLGERVEPPVFLSRSTIYRYLREVNLHTRQRRLEYAGQEFEFSEADSSEAVQEA